MALKESAERVQSRFRDMGFDHRVVELPDSTRTAEEAAAAIGCEVAQIAKSIIFRLSGSNKPVLVVASGVNRINEKMISSALNDNLKKADADFTRSALDKSEHFHHFLHPIQAAQMGLQRR